MPDLNWLEPDDRRGRRLLRDLRVSSVDLVDKGANPGARIAFFKRKKEETFEAELSKAAAARVAKSAGKLTREQAKVAIMNENPKVRAAYAELAHAELHGPAPERPPHPVVAKLRKLREERGVTQTSVAKSIGSDQPHVSRFESSPRPSYDAIKSYADAIGLSNAELAEVLHGGSS